MKPSFRRRARDLCTIELEIAGLRVGLAAREQHAAGAQGQRH